MATIPGAPQRELGSWTTASRVHEPPSLGWMLLLAAALFALALPIVGPLDDHHFAERSHNHDHIYLDGAPVAHDHTYEGSGRHAHQESGPRISLPDRREGAGSVLYLSPVTAGLTLAALNAPYHPAPESLRPPPPSATEGNPIRRFAPGSIRPHGENVPPPLPPPII